MTHQWYFFVQILDHPIIKTTLASTMGGLTLAFHCVQQGPVWKRYTWVKIEWCEPAFLANQSSKPTKFSSCESRSALLAKERLAIGVPVKCRFVSQPTYKTTTWLAMAVKDWSATRPFLLKSDLWLTMAVRYWYTMKIGVLNNDLRFVVLC